jgi:PAS domain S-box-containing protein
MGWEGLATEAAADHPVREESDGPVLVVDRDGRILFADAQRLSAFGLRAEELVGRSAFVALGERQEVLAGIDRALSGAASEARVETDRGRICLRFEPCAGRGGAADPPVAGLCVFAPELRSRGAATDEAGDPRQLDRLLGEFPGAIWTTDRNLRITGACGRAAGLLTRRGARAVGATLFELRGTNAPTEPGIAHHLAALVGQRTSFEHEQDGRVHLVNIEPLHAERGGGGGAGREIVGCLGVSRDVTEERRTEAKLAKTEARLMAAQRFAHLGTWEWDVEAGTFQLSEELHRILGLPPGAFDAEGGGGGTYDAFLARIHPEDVERTKHVLFESYRRRGPFSLEHRIVRPDGSVRMVGTRGEVLDDGAGRGIHVFGICWDVTGRWEATRALERSISALRATLEATTDGVLVTERSGRVTLFNHRFLEIWGLAAEAAAGADHPALLARRAEALEEAGALLQHTRELYARLETEGFDVLRFRDGRVVERRSWPQRIGDEVVGRVWILRDVTDRERLLRRAMLLSDASRLLASLELEPALESIAKLALPQLGEACQIDLFSDERGPRRLLSVVQPDAKPGRTELAPGVLAGHSLVYEIDGASYMAVPLKARGALLGAFTFSSSRPGRYEQADLELAAELAHRAALALENARLHSNAQQALRAREEFLSVAAHEIRGPITSLHLAAQRLCKQEDLPPVALRLCEMIDRDDRRLARLVDELLDVARIGRGALQFHYGRVDLAEITGAVASDLSAELSRSGSPLSITVEGPVVGEWDRSRLEQVVTNLLTNAIKFGQRRPIVVSLGACDGVARLVVKDHGGGISPQMHERIFQPFERAVPARHYGGLGLGLYIVASIVRGLGGTVRVESTPGDGATFVVELPQARPA